MVFIQNYLFCSILSLFMIISCLIIAHVPEKNESTSGWYFFFEKYPDCITKYIIRYSYIESFRRTLFLFVFTSRKKPCSLTEKKRIETIHKWFTYLNNIPSRFQSGESKGANIEIHEIIFIGNCLVKSCSLNMKETKHKKVTTILWF